MIDTQSLKNKILDLATSGQLSKNHICNDSVEDVINSLPTPSEKRKKLLKQDFEYDDVGAIPNHWKWVSLGEISSYGDTPQKVIASEVDDNTWILELEDIEAGGKLLEKKRAIQSTSKGEKTVFKTGQVLYSKLRPYLKKVLIADENGVSTPELVSFDVFNSIDAKYIVLCLLNTYTDKVINKRSYGIKMPRVDAGFMVNLSIPLPPVSEQKYIVSKVEDIFAEIDTIEKLQTQYAADSEILKSKLIDAAIQGKLTEQFPSDGTAEELYQQILTEKQALISAGKIKKEKPLKEIEEDEIPFEIPESWKWVRFGDISYIERGGSPRPIKQYLTDDANGINWIKIGDVEKGGKYIFKTKEKIKPEGEKKSRRVYPDDFLLTNSMSFGRPYISKIEGCVHDGWLIIRNLGGVSADYLYYLLSAKFLYEQFCQKASGSTVSNLNIEKVNSAIIPLPPIKEQERIANRIEELLKECN